MPVEAMSVHDPKHPQAFYSGKVFDDKLAVLVSLFNVGYHAHPRFATVLLNDALGAIVI